MNDEPRPSDDERDIEERLRRFRCAEPRASVWQAIEERTEPRRLRVWRRLSLAAVALLIAAVTLAVVIYRQSPPERRAPVPRPAPEGIACGAWDKASLELSLVKLRTMANDPEMLLNYLDVRSRPLRTKGDTLTVLSLLNGA